MKTTFVEARCAVDPTVQAFLDQTNQPSPVRPTTPAEVRAAESRMQDIDVAKLRADIEDGNIPGPSGQIGIRITRPLGAKEELPAVMYFHGGGWVVGDRDTHDRLVRDLAHSAHDPAIVLSTTRARRKHSIPLRSRRRTQRPRGSRRMVDRSVWIRRGWPWLATALAETWQRW